MVTSFKESFMRFIRIAWSLFLSGLIAILPIAITIAIFNITFRLVKGWLAPIQKVNIPILSSIPHYEIILVILFILAVGAILQIFILRSLINYLETVIMRIPLVRPVYGGVKQLVDAFSSQDKVTFKQVVMLEFPIEGVYSIGFLTGEMPQALTPNHMIKYYNVFIPTTPNPTTGYFVLVPENKIKVTHLNRQEAMALIISGGIICPDRFIEHK
jgi:uncharacterized membrane protein